LSWKLEYLSWSLLVYCLALAKSVPLTHSIFLSLKQPRWSLSSFNFHMVLIAMKKGEDQTAQGWGPLQWLYKQRHPTNYIWLSSFPCFEYLLNTEPSAGCWS
jgi:hypothetical protein